MLFQWWELSRLWFFLWSCMDVRVGLWRKLSTKIDAFELWCWRRLLRVPWTARRSNQSILKEISLGCSLEGMMLKLKLQYFGHLMRRANSLEKTLMLGGIGGRRKRDDRGWDGWMTSQTWWTWVWVNSRSWWWTGRPGLLWFMGSEGVRHDWLTELNWWRNNSSENLYQEKKPYSQKGKQSKLALGFYRAIIQARRQWNTTARDTRTTSEYHSQLNH